MNTIQKTRAIAAIPLVVGITSCGTGTADDESVILVVSGQPGPADRGKARVMRAPVDGDVRTLYVASVGSFAWTMVSPEGWFLTAEPSRDGIRQVVRDSAGRLREPGWVELLKQHHLVVSNQAGSPSFSLDGTLVAFIATRGIADRSGPSIWIVDLSKPALREIAVPAEFRYLRTLAWSPDNSRFAFYFAPTANDMDLALQNYGLALLDTEGAARVLVAPSATNQFTGARMFPPLWSPDGSGIYFVGGPRQGVEDPSDWWYPSAFTYRYTLSDQRVDLVSPGQICDIAPDGSYVLLRNCPSDEVAAHGTVRRREPRCCKVYVPALKRAELPRSVVAPKLSASGRYAVNWRHSSGTDSTLLEFYNASDWTIIRIVDVPMRPIEDAWASSVFWLRGQGEQPESSPSRKAPAATGGGVTTRPRPRRATTRRTARRRTGT